MRFAPFAAFIAFALAETKGVYSLLRYLELKLVVITHADVVTYALVFLSGNYHCTVGAISKASCDKQDVSVIGFSAFSPFG